MLRYCQAHGAGGGVVRKLHLQEANPALCPALGVESAGCSGTDAVQLYRYGSGTCFEEHKFCNTC